MTARRLAILLCVLLVHALVVYRLLHIPPSVFVPLSWDDADVAPITLEDQPPLPSDLDAFGQEPRVQEIPAVIASPAGIPLDAAALPDTSHVDWPLEGRKAAARVLASEAEAERIAKMFAGPGGTWASLTKRQRSKLSKFRFRPGVMGLEYDTQGNLIYHISDGCVIVNSMFFACALGKPRVRDDMFDNMREYFDEQRLPQTHEGNGTEPEALRPAN